jgi:hypothetical protein
MIAPLVAPLVVPHNEYAGIELSLSRDRNRLSIGVVLNQRGQWIGSGPAPSIPASMIDTAINALMQMRDQLVVKDGGR